MKIGGFNKFSLIDYPGKVSAVIFTQGCNFRCPFCHNRELVLPELFQECIPEDEISDFLLKRKKQLDGVVITGGEPTIQNDLIEFISEIKNMGFLIKLDTNGSQPKTIQKLINSGSVDYIAMDIKAPLEKYHQLIGVNFDRKAIEKSIELIRSSKIDFEFRTTVVKPFLKLEDLDQIKKIIGNTKYKLQNFVSSSKLVNKEFTTECITQYSDEEIRKFRNWLFTNT